MNKTAIRNYAVWARTALIEAVTQKAFEYEIKDGAEMNGSLESIGGRLLTSDEKEWRKKLIDEIKHKNFNQVMEEAAYTWFNRFIALRYMEVNGFIPSRVRVFTNENGEFKPDILKEAMTVELEGLKREKVIDLIEKQNNEELFKYLIITQCNALNQGLPYMFEKISNWTELLFPANLLRADSIIGRMINEIPEEDFEDEVEIIGWLYQFYITEKHEEVIDPLHGKTIKKEDIPAATQLFTTDWVVRYILDNSLGRYWIERHPESQLASKLTYLVTPKDGSIETVNETISPEELKVLDPCVGSGHFLSYAFDILLEIYRECGWSDRDAAKSILENNLHGLDIDDRAAQLACFAVAMKARKYNRRILNGETSLNIFAMQDSDFITEDIVHYFAGKDEKLRNDINELRITFNNAKEYGSIISVPKLDFAALYERIDTISRSFAEDIFQIGYQNTVIEQLLPLVKQAEILSKKYDIVATNPPYMNKYSPRLKDYINRHFADYKGDLFSVFMFRNFAFCKENGYSGFMTPNVWMFIKSYEELRKYIITNKSITTLIQMAKGAFFKEATVDICAFVLTNKQTKNNGLYIRLEDFKGDMEVQKQKVIEALSNKECGYYHEVEQSNFSKLPSSPIAYWLSDSFLNVFSDGKLLGEIADSRQGIATADNNKYLRLWSECDYSNIFFDCKNHDESKTDNRKWYPYNKGGEFRKWYGNNEYVVNWFKDGMELRADKKAVLRNPNYYFKHSFSWSLISSSVAAFRYKPYGQLFDVAGMSCFANKHFYYLLALCNTNIVMEILKVIAPTINYQCGDIANIPVIIDSEKAPFVEETTKQNINFSKADWDSFETSWDFKVHPMIKYSNCLWDATAVGATMSKYYGRELPKHNSPIELCYLLWQGECNERFNNLKANEEELNRIFIDIYGLKDELTPDVADKDVTVRKADLGRDIRSFISYAVGCIFGRYSLNAEGICYAGGEWQDAIERLEGIRQEAIGSSDEIFVPDEDNILPICDDEYFDDDLANKIFKWVEVVYGKETLEENLRFIADALGGKGTAREVIRNYLLNGFYADHLKIYQKRPIYWQFSSGKKNGFKALVYMHRYQPDLLARMRTDYVHEQQERYRTQLTMLEESVDSAAPSEKVKINKQIAKLRDQSLEIQKFEEKVHHLADQMITIDLDDGVKVNYAKFEDVLEKIK